MNSSTKSAYLQSRAVLRLTGPDRYSFLQGLVSQDMRLVEEGRPVFTAFLTPQGKYLFDFFVVPETDYILIDCEGEQVNDFVKRLSFFKMRSDVMLLDARSQYAVYGLWGKVSDHPRAFTDPRFSGLDERMIVPRDLMNTIPTNSDENYYREHRLKCGVAEGHHEIEVGQATLLEINFDFLNAISWDKGCYMGQELTARTKYRGLIKKRYLPFKFEGQPPEKHQDILHNGFGIGRVMAIGDKYGLGLFSLDKIRPFVDSKSIIVDKGTTFEVFLPDYLKDTIFPKLLT